MAGDEARLKRGQIAFDNVKISATDAAGENAQDDVPWFQSGPGYVFDFEVWSGRGTG
jgi:hypothetical protein